MFKDVVIYICKIYINREKFSKHIVRKNVTCIFRNSRNRFRLKIAFY